MTEETQPTSGMHIKKIDNPSHMRAMMGPMMADHTLRQAIQHCWMMLPDDKRNIDQLEVEIQRLVQRAFHNIREDAKAFGLE